MRLLLLALLLALPGTALAAVACPERLPEIAPAGFERGGLGAGRGANTPLREVWLIDGLPGEETAGAPTILAPEERRGRPPRVLNGWSLPANEPRLLVCIYGEGVWLRLALPPGLRRCTQAAGPEPMSMRCE
jgi:hypothetical protein